MVQDPASRRGLSRLVFQILLSAAEPSVKDALAIFLLNTKSL
jgi:hypothetical protein